MVTLDLPRGRERLHFCGPQAGCGLTSTAGVLSLLVTGALYLGVAFTDWMARDGLLGGVYGRPIHTRPSSARPCSPTPPPGQADERPQLRMLLTGRGVVPASGSGPSLRRRVLFT